MGNQDRPGERPLWRESFGVKGRSRVTVYERYHGSNLYIEWWLDGQRYQRSLRTVTGDPVTDRRLAMEIAKEVSTEQERLHNRRARRNYFGPRMDRTLGDLLDTLHEHRSPDWSKSHVRDQERYRGFWTEKLGADLKLAAVNEPMVEAIARDEARRRNWRPRTHGAYLRYMKDAFNFAADKMKWIDPRQKLTGLDIPDPKPRKNLSYSREEIPRLLGGLRDMDVPRRWRDVPEWVGQTLWQTGRRLTAVATLPKDAVTLHEEYAVIDFPEETDKVREGGEAVVTDRAFRLLAILMGRKGAYVAGTETPSMDVLQEWIDRAEDEAGIEHVKGRSWHGIKRRFSNAAKGLPGRGSQAGTLESTLEGKYDPADDREAKLEVARALAAKAREDDDESN